MNRASPIAISLAFGPHSCASTVNATVGGWRTGNTVCFTPMLFPEVLNAKQGNSMYHFSSLWYDSTGHRTPTYRVQSDHSTTGPRTWLLRHMVFESLRVTTYYHAPRSIVNTCILYVLNFVEHAQKCKVLRCSYDSKFVCLFYSVWSILSRSIRSAVIFSSIGGGGSRKTFFLGHRPSVSQGSFSVLFFVCLGKGKIIILRVHR